MMKNPGLILNQSYDDFILGHSIVKYKNRPHQIDKHEVPYKWECYTFVQNGFEFELWCENNIIKSICCNQSCIYKGQELINMNYKNFLHIIDEVPVSHDVIYVCVSDSHGQNQHVYDFEKSGLQIWVWRNRIRTVIISNTHDNGG